VFGGAYRLRFGILGRVSVFSGLLRQSSSCIGVPGGMVRFVSWLLVQIRIISGVFGGIVRFVS